MVINKWCAHIQKCDDCDFILCTHCKTECSGCQKEVCAVCYFDHVILCLGCENEICPTAETIFSKEFNGAICAVCNMRSGMQ